MFKFYRTHFGSSSSSWPKSQILNLRSPPRGRDSVPARGLVRRQFQVGIHYAWGIQQIIAGAQMSYPRIWKWTPI